MTCNCRYKDLILIIDSMKQYNGEKAIISLTSWKARINTVSKTIYSLIKQCPGFHIVLVLSEDEFPQKEAKLPSDLMLFVENNLIELLWVKLNFKAFKKVLFTMNKYPSVPIISADDDCIYKYNYAEELYKQWLLHKNNVVSYKNAKQFGVNATWGCATLYPPNYFKDYGLLWLNGKIVNMGLDDNYYVVLRKRLKLFGTTYINKQITQVIYFANEAAPLHAVYRRNNLHSRAYKLINNLISAAHK